MERCFALQVEAGVDGIIVAGSLGEGPMLSMDEKLAVMQTAKSVAGKLPVLMTINDAGTREAEAMTLGDIERWAEAARLEFLLEGERVLLRDPSGIDAVHVDAIAHVLLRCLEYFGFGLADGLADGLAEGCE